MKSYQLQRTHSYRDFPEMRWKSLYAVSLGPSSLLGVGSTTDVQQQLQYAATIDIDAAASEYDVGVGMDLTSNYG